MGNLSILQAMLSGDFADDTNDIEIPDIDPETFNTLLKYVSVYLEPKHTYYTIVYMYLCLYVFLKCLNREIYC